MKKNLILFILALTLCSALPGCQKTTTKESEPAIATEEKITDEKTEKTDSKNETMSLTEMKELNEELIDEADRDIMENGVQEDKK